MCYCRGNHSELSPGERSGTRDYGERYPHIAALMRATILFSLHFGGQASSLPSLRSANCFAACATEISAHPCDTTTRQANHPKVCPALPRKIFRLTRRANQRHYFARLTQTRGGSRSSRTCGGMRWTRSARKTNVHEAYGEVVWSWRRGAGVKLVAFSASDGDNKARSPGRARSKP